MWRPWIFYFAKDLQRTTYFLPKSQHKWLYLRVQRSYTKLVWIVFWENKNPFLSTLAIHLYFLKTGPHMSQAGFKLAIAKDDHELLSLCSRVLVIGVRSRPPGAFWVSDKYSHDEANGRWESTNIEESREAFSPRCLRGGPDWGYLDLRFPTCRTVTPNFPLSSVTWSVAHTNILTKGNLWEQRIYLT